VEEARVDDTIPFDEAVREGKDIRARIDEAENGHLRLGELADKIKPVYGDRTLAKFAKACGFNTSCMERYRSVYRAWKDFPAPGPVSYAVLRELQKYPDKASIAAKLPGMTKSQARELMTDGEDYVPKKKKKDAEWLKYDKKWFKKVVTLGSDAARAADFAARASSDQMQKLLEVSEPALLAQVRTGCEALLKLARSLEKLHKAAETKEAKPQQPRRAASARKLNGAAQHDDAAAAA
jgi:hypothetical protein